MKKVISITQVPIIYMFKDVMILNIKLTIKKLELLIADIEEEVS